MLVAEPPATGGAPHGVAPVREQKEAPVPRVVLVDAVTGEAHPLTRADLYVHEYAWSPDGGRLAVIGSPPPALRWYNSKIYVVDARSGAERALMTPPQQIAAPCWSPDGRSIAFISGLMSDESDTAGDVYLTSADGSSAGRNLTPGFHGSARSLAWPTGDRVVFSASVDGGSAIATVDANAKLDLLWSDATEAAGVPAFSADGKVTALARESITAAPELWAGPLGDWKQVTHTNDGIRATWGAARSVHWKSDGATVQGWLVAPPVVEPQKRGRLVVVVHGGPAAMARPYFAGGLYAPWVDERTYVFCPNPRGSYGQGEAFTAANVKDFGPGPMRDILAGVDEVVRTTPVDGARVGLTGWSYGGFMTMWMVTQTTRFHAAVAGAGIANWQSYRGQIEVPDWMQPYFGKSVYDDPQVYARSSPIEFITRAKTPTLLLVGENDEYCPASQSYEFWRALKAQGVETELVVYPGEGHGLGKSEHRRDRIVRTLRWFDAHL